MIHFSTHWRPEEGIHGGILGFPSSIPPNESVHVEIAQKCPKFNITPKSKTPKLSGLRSWGHLPPGFLVYFIIFIIFVLTMTKNLTMAKNPRAHPLQSPVPNLQFPRVVNATATKI